MVDHVTKVAEAELKSAYELKQKQARQQRLKEIGAKVEAECIPADAAPGYANARQEFPVRTRSEARPQSDPVRRAAHRRPRYAHRATDFDSQQRTAAYTRLGAVHSRRNPGAGSGDVGYRARRADHRCAARRISRTLHAPLQHAALRDRRNRPRRHAEAARSRARSPGEACAGGGAAVGRRVCLLDARRVRNHRVQRQFVDGVGMRRQPCADGRRRAAESARRRHRDGPDQGRQPLRRPDRHSRRRGSPRRHGFQGRGNRSRCHCAADGHQDPGHHQGHHGASHCRRRAKAACIFSA